MAYQIKEVTYEDIRDYMNVNITSWIESYPGLVADSYLHEIDTNREKYITRQQLKFLENKSNNSSDKKFLLLVDNEPVGMTSCGPSHDPKHPNTGEIYSIYLLNKVKGKGYGKILFLNNVQELLNMGFNSMVIGCLKGNKANDFYLHMGGKLIDTYERQIDKQVIPENVYYFSNLQELIK